MPNISLQEQELIRNIADLVIHDPNRAHAMFGNFEQIIQLYPELSGVFSLINNSNGDHRTRYYQDVLTDEINRIRSPAIRNIFYSAINSYNNNNYYY